MKKIRLLTLSLLSVLSLASCGKGLEGPIQQPGYEEYLASLNQNNAPNGSSNQQNGSSSSSGSQNGSSQGQSGQSTSGSGEGQSQGGGEGQSGGSNSGGGSSNTSDQFPLDFVASTLSVSNNIPIPTGTSFSWEVDNNFEYSCFVDVVGGSYVTYSNLLVNSGFYCPYISSDFGIVDYYMGGFHILFENLSNNSNFRINYFKLTSQNDYPFEHYYYSFPIDELNSYVFNYVSSYDFGYYPSGEFFGTYMMSNVYVMIIEFGSSYELRSYLLFQNYTEEDCTEEYGAYLYKKDGVNIEVYPTDYLNHDTMYGMVVYCNSNGTSQSYPVNIVSVSGRHEYSLNEYINPDEFDLEVLFSDGNTYIVHPDYTDGSTNEVGTFLINLYYRGLVNPWGITVVDNNPSSNPYPVEIIDYIGPGSVAQCSTLDIREMMVLVRYSDGSTSWVQPDRYEFDSTILGYVPINIYFEDLVYHFVIIVDPAPSPVLDHFPSSEVDNVLWTNLRCIPEGTEFRFINDETLPGNSCTVDVYGGNVLEYIDALYDYGFYMVEQYDGNILIEGTICGDIYVLIQNYEDIHEYSIKYAREGSFLGSDDKNYKECTVFPLDELHSFYENKNISAPIVITYGDYFVFRTDSTVVTVDIYGGDYMAYLDCFANRGYSTETSYVKEGFYVIRYGDVLTVIYPDGLDGSGDHYTVCFFDWCYI